jgi:gamma-polyglutamate biosynthesis protein CapA
MRQVALSILPVLTGIGFFLLHTTLMRTEPLAFPHVQFGAVASSFEESTLLFTGDIMLGRRVEELMEEHGDSFPFTYIETYVRKATRAVGNFEAAAPEKHVRTPLNVLRLSVPPSGFSALQNAGFDILSLSNNHSMDYGIEGFEHTRATCDEANLSCFGNPLTPDATSIHYEKIGDTQIGILALHTLAEDPSTSTLEVLLTEMKKSSDVQFAYIHWGDEYVLTHNASQERLAHFLIDEGIDAVIGHHPHVAQDVELYDGKPIFYSLGNLIFDQYFSGDVEEGYMVEARFKKGNIVYTLIPIESHTERSQPRLMEGDERTRFLSSLLRYPRFNEEEVVSGQFSILRD